MACPAEAHESVRAAELELPVGNRTRIVLDVDIETGMGIHPLHLGHRACERHRFGGVVFGGKRVMRHHWRGGGEQTEASHETEELSSHRYTSQMIIVRL